MPNEHAKLSASGSERWLNCSGSIKLEENMPEQTSSFAEEGTKAHSLAESILKAYLNNSYLTIDADKDMLNNVNEYVYHCIDLMDELKLNNEDFEAHVEYQVDFSKWVDGGFGTIDFLLLTNDKIIIRDLKYGKGVEVDSNNNSQLILYALGAYDTFNFLYDFKKVSIGIIQPRLNNISISEYDIKYILEKGKLYKAKAKEALSDKASINPGKWCKFCKVRAICKVRALYFFKALNDILRS